MRLNSIRLKNIGPHRDLFLEFGPGLIMLCGPQGSGKSSVFNAYYGALTNDFTRMQDTKEEVICQQAAPHELSQIIIDAEHGGTQFVLTRTLAPKVTSRLQTSNGIDLKKSSEVESALAQLMGSSRKVLDTYVFVEQWKLLELLTQKPAERSNTLSHLCGTAFIEGRFELLGKQLTADLQLQQSVAVLDIDTVRQELGLVNEQLTNENKIIVRLRSELLDAESLAAMGTAIREYDQAANVRLLLPGKRTQLEELDRAIGSLQTSHENVERQLTTSESELEDASNERHRIRQEVATLDGKVQAWAALVRAKTNLASIEASLKNDPAPTLAVVEELDQIDESIANTRKLMTPHQAVVEKLQGLANIEDGLCPTCEEPLKNAAQKLSEAQAALVPLTERLTTLTARRARRVKYEADVRVYNSQQQSLKRTQTSLQEEIAAVGDITQPTESLPELKAQEQKANTKYEKLRDDTRQLKTTVSTSLQQLEGARGRYKALEADVDKDTAYLATTEVLKQSEYQEYNEMIAKSRQVELDLAGAVARQQEYGKQIKAKEEAIAKAERLRERSEQLTNLIGVWSRARAVLHRDNLPRKVHQSALQKMEAGINGMLARFESPFTVTTSDDLTYIGHFRNGTVTKDRRLSGGQKVVLMLAFRWRLNSVFASQIGMLVLDEPTAGLDPRHLELLETTLLNLSAAAKSQGIQVFIITHELRLKHVFDQVVELERPIL